MSDSGSIIRRRMLPFEANYTMVPNALLRESRLSLKAKGLLSYMLSHRDGFQSGLEEIAGDSADGLAAVRSGLTELKQHGWVKVYRERDEKRKLRWVYELCEPGLPLDFPVDKSPSKIELDRPVQFENRSQVDAEIASPYEEKTREKNSPRRAPSVRPARPVEDAPGFEHHGQRLPHGLWFDQPCEAPGPHRVNVAIRNDLACIVCGVIPAPRPVKVA